MSSNAIAWIEKHAERIDVLINNAAIAKTTPIEEVIYQDLETVLNTNLLASTYLTHKAIKCMKAHDIVGTIVNINSVGGQYIKTTFHGTYNYNASKFGLRAFTEFIRLELASSGSKIRMTV